MQTIQVPETYDEYMDLLDKGDKNPLLAVPTKTIAGWIYDEFKKSHQVKQYEVMRTLSDRLHLSEAIRSGSLNRKVGEFNAYTYIPLSNSHFIRQVLLAEQYVRSSGAEIVSFVDCGCGMGDKLLLLETILGDHRSSWRIGGVEYDKNYLMFANHRGVMLGDITTWDYCSHNLIYAYNPMNDQKGMEAFFKRVASTAKSGAVCVFVNVDTGVKALRKFKKKFTEISEFIFQVK